LQKGMPEMLMYEYESVLTRSKKQVRQLQLL
jgi:hypothetical protein